LKGLGQLPDLVEEERSPVRDLDHPRLRAVGAGERAALVTEQLGLEQRVGKGGAVHRDEHLGGSAALRVDRAGDQLLPRPRLSLDQYVGLGPGGLPHELEDRAHRGALTDDVVEARARRQRLPEPTILLDQATAFGGAPDGEAQHVVGREGLQEVVECSRPHGFDRGFDRPVAGDHDHDGIRIHLEGAGEHLHPVGARHLEIREDDLGALTLEERQRTLAVRGRDARVVLTTEKPRPVVDDVRLVVHDQDTWLRAHLAPTERHGSTGRSGIGWSRRRRA
jgi:hypothetical protein